MTDPTCPGRCCAVFPLGQLTKAAVVAGGVSDPEWAYIADMIVPLTWDEAANRSRDLGYGDLPEYWTLGEQNLFTCRHWDEATRLCAAYEQRPKMCRDYPYNRSCDHGCGHHEAPEVQAEYDRLAESAEAAGIVKP